MHNTKTKLYVGTILSVTVELSMHYKSTIEIVHRTVVQFNLHLGYTKGIVHLK